MAGKKVVESRTHKLSLVGGKSFSVVLPVEFVRRLKWKEGQKLDVILEGKTLVVTPWKK